MQLQRGLRWAALAVAFGLALEAGGMMPAQQAAGTVAGTSAQPVREPRPVRLGVAAAGVVQAIDTITPKHVYAVAGSPDWSVMAGDAVWVSSARLNHVVQLLPSTGKVGVTAEVKRPCSGLAYGFGSVWVPSCGTHTLDRLDLATGKIAAEIAADPANSEGGIAIGAGSVWMVVKPSTLVRIDPATDAVVARLALPPGSENPAFGGGFLWVSSSAESALLKIDPARGEVVQRTAVGPKPRFLTVGDGSVWTLNQGDGTISRVDMATGRLLASIACGIPGPGGEIAYGAGSVWAAMFEFPLTQVDVKTNLPVHQWKGPGGDGVRFGFGAVWLSNLQQQTVWEIVP